MSKRVDNNSAITTRPSLKYIYFCFQVQEGARHNSSEQLRHRGCGRTDREEKLLKLHLAQQDQWLTYIYTHTWHGSAK